MKKLAPISLVLFLAFAGTASAAHANPAACIVPKLTGLTLPKARTRLERAHCATGVIVGPHAGTVRAQVPKAGRREKHSSKVKLTLQLKSHGGTKLTVGNTTYTSSVDPTFTQNPTNPLQVTYAVSADATESANGISTNLADTGQLPAGVLNFYSATTPGGPPSALECSMNVGGSNDGANCTVTYPNTGTYTVVTEYIPNGVTAVQETEQETINPFSTNTAISTSVGAVTGNSFPIFVAANVFGQGGNQLDNQPLTYTITDSTTNQEVTSFVFTGIACQITESVNFNSTVTWWGDSCAPTMAVTVPLNDSYEITASFGGTIGYTSSTSNPAVF